MLKKILAVLMLSTLLILLSSCSHNGSSADAMNTHPSPQTSVNEPAFPPSSVAKQTSNKATSPSTDEINTTSSYDAAMAAYNEFLLSRKMRQ